MSITVVRSVSRMTGWSGNSTESFLGRLCQHEEMCCKKIRTYRRGRGGGEGHVETITKRNLSKQLLACYCIAMKLERLWGQRAASDDAKASSREGKVLDKQALLLVEVRLPLIKTR